MELGKLPAWPSARSGWKPIPTPRSSEIPYDSIYEQLQSANLTLHSYLNDVESLEDKRKGSLKNYINQLLNSDYSSLMDTCDSLIVELQELILKIEKGEYFCIAQKILMTIVSIRDWIISQKASSMSRKTRASITDVQRSAIRRMSVSPSSSSLNMDASSANEDISTDDSTVCDLDNLVVCRICESRVPLDLIEEHVKSCIDANKNANIILKANAELQKVIIEIKEQCRGKRWPGVKNVATSSILPLVRLMLLIQQALCVDVNLEDAEEELGIISKNLVRSKTSTSSVAVNMFLQKTQPILKQKLIASKAAYDAQSIRRNTLAGYPEISSATRTTQISDFDFIKRISSGAYGRVFLAKKKATGDIYAVKVIPKSSLQEKNHVKRVLVEKNILLMFNNEYIVKFYYSVIGSHNLYLIMEFLPGGDFYSLLEHCGCLEEDVAKYYSAQILLALKYLHENGIIHRDLKPDNIVIDKNGFAKLTDFGLSHMGMNNRIADSSLSKASSLVGTPDYVAPEIILNMPHTATCDYWSFGVILYELLTGVPPFNGENEEETHRNILTKTLTFDEEDAEISDEAKDLICKLLVRNPNERLGAKGINEIFEHPWFAGYDVSLEEPPFVPAGTSNFEQRYKFSPKDDLDIIYDMEHPDTPENQPAKQIQEEFASTDFGCLADATREVANRRRRSMSSIASPLAAPLVKPIVLLGQAPEVARAAPPPVAPSSPVPRGERRPSLPQFPHRHPAIPLAKRNVDIKKIIPIKPGLRPPQPLPKLMIRQTE